MSDLSGHVLLVELLTYIFEKYGFICNTIKRVNTLEPSISDKESLITIKKSTNCGKPFKENKIIEKVFKDNKIIEKVFKDNKNSEKVFKDNKNSEKVFKEIKNFDAHKRSGTVYEFNSIKANPLLEKNIQEHENLQNFSDKNKKRNLSANSQFDLKKKIDNGQKNFIENNKILTNNKTGVTSRFFKKIDEKFVKMFSERLKKDLKNSKLQKFETFEDSSRKKTEFFKENKEKWVKEIIKSLSSSDWLKFSKENDSLGQLKQQAMIEYLSEEKNTLALISRAEKL